MKLRMTLILLAAVGLIATAYVPGSEISNESRFDTETIPDELSTKTIEGALSGFDCAVVGELCPTTHRGADYTTGVFTEEDTFYFVVNIPQSFLQQYFRKR